jgi:hypothetical protein
MENLNVTAARRDATMVKPWPWMHLEAKRLTEKSLPSKMFLSPIFPVLLLERVGALMLVNQ